MLNLMREHARSWIIKVMLFAIMVVFAFWGVGSWRTQDTQVADVNGETITQEVYRQAYYRLLDNYRRVYGAQMDDNLLNMLKPNEMALNQLIEKILLTQEAERLNIDVTEEELAEVVRSIPAFQKNGVFDYQLYNQILNQNKLSVEQFEMDRSEELALNKLRAVVLDGITVSEDEAKEWYNWSNAKVSISHAVFATDRYKDVKPTDEQVQAFFNDHKDNYRTEPKVKLRYLHFDPDAYKAEIQISDDMISEYYQENPAEFKTEKQVSARHILFKVDKGADEKTSESKKAEALKVHEMAKSGKKFADLAKQYSQGPTKNKGGDLGWFTRDRMEKPFADKAFSMAQGEISGPVRTSFGWHLIKVEKVEEASKKSLETAKNEIKGKLTVNQAKAQALEKAEDLYDTVYDGDELVAVAKEHQVAVSETDFFTADGSAVKVVAQGQQFAQAAFKLEKMAISEVQDFGNGYYILQVLERAEATIPDFEKVVDTVSADTIKDQREQRAKKDAEAFLESVKNGKTFADAGVQFNTKPVETAFFERNGAIPGVGNEPQISKAAFELTPDRPLAQKAIQGRKGWYVILLKERQAPKDEGFGEEKETIVNRLTEQKRQAAYQSWLADLKARGEIVVNKDLIKP